MDSKTLPSADAVCLARAHADRGNVCAKRGDNPGAIVWFTRALGISPDDPFLLMRRGGARGAIDDVAGAAADLRRAVQLLAEDGASGRHWALSQLGEAIRMANRDLVIAPEASATEVETLMATLEEARTAFSGAIEADPGSAWAYGHRGAVEMLQYWLLARAGLDPDRARGQAEASSRDLARALEIREGYAWAMVFQAFLTTVVGSNEPDEAARAALFERAAERVEASGRAGGPVVVARPLAELALYRRDYEQIVRVGWPRLLVDGDDPITRYCVAVAVERLDAGADEEEADGRVASARKEATESVLRQTRKALMMKRTRTAAMLGGIAMLEGQFEVATAMLEDVLEYPDMDTLVFLWRDPAWDLARGGDGDDKGLVSVREAYARLFPSRP